MNYSVISRLKKKSPTNTRDEPRRVKLFSISRRLIFTFVFYYISWFLANQWKQYEIPHHFQPFFGWLTLISGFTIASMASISPFFPNNITLFLDVFKSSRLRGVVIVMIFITLLLHAKLLIVERVMVDGASMEPTLRNSERVWIEKMSAGFHIPDLSFPFGAIHPTGRIPQYGIPPERADVVVFQIPGDRDGSGHFLIKRVIALPGDVYKIENCSVSVNGVPLVEPYLEADSCTTGENEDHRLLMPGFYTSEMEKDPLIQYASLFGAPPSGKVPDNTIFVLGDNRTQSRDSRTLGFIPIFRIEGSVFSK